MRTERGSRQRKAIRCGDRVASDGGRGEKRRERQLGLKEEVFTSQVPMVRCKDRGVSNVARELRERGERIISNVYAALQPMHGKCANHLK